MKKKKSTTQKTSGNGFDELIRVHTDALMKNSQDIAEMLEIVQQKVGKSKRNKEKYERDLNFITKELNKIDKNINGLGGK